VAFDPARYYPGFRDARLRSVDHLETGVYDDSKRISGNDRLCMHVPSRQSRRHYDIVRAWIVIAIASGSGAAVAEILASKGH
jgi:hypothetical protein